MGDRLAVVVKFTAKSVYELLDTTVVQALVLNVCVGVVKTNVKPSAVVPSDDGKW
jgi:hypothetical protein